MFLLGVGFDGSDESDCKKGCVLKMVKKQGKVASLEGELQSKS